MEKATPKFKNEVSSFRHRGFQMVDGAGVPVDGVPIEMVFGSGPGPTSPPSSDDRWVTVWDHWVVETTTVAQYANQDLPTTGDAGTVADPA